MIDIHGTVAEGFEKVRTEFSTFVEAERGEPRAQLAAFLNGRLVVDLWAGEDTTGDSLTGVFSSTKGATFLTTALLVQEGAFDLDERVAHYWPEFAAEGKDSVTVRELLSHRAGIVGVDGGFTLAELADDRRLAARLAGQRPYWAPGTASGYHAFVIGALIGEVVRRVTERSVQQLYEERIRAPRGLDLYLGLPQNLEHRYRDILPWLATPEQEAAFARHAPAPDSIAGVAYILNANPPLDQVNFPNTRTVRAGGQASGGGVGNARGLAGLYAAAISEVDGISPLLTAETIAEFSTNWWPGVDLVFGQPDVFALGFERKSPRFPGLGLQAFGHSGAAGSEAFADPASGIAYGYTRRRFAFGYQAPEHDRLAQAVVEAAALV